MPKYLNNTTQQEKIMDAYTKRLFRSKIPTLIVTALILLIGLIGKILAV
jgi:LPS O-antigen subunit length determinant protein (WzzB/FepE family)